MGQPPTKRTLVVLTVALFPFLVFIDATVGRRSFFFFDLQYLFLPRFKFNIEAVRQGELPLWNSYSFGGVPHLGDSQAAVLYPLSYLFFPFEPVHAFNLFIVVLFALAGAGMALLTREYGLSRPAMAIAAIAYQFSGFQVGHLVHPSLLAASAWIPWIFWRAELTSKDATAWRMATLVLVLSLQILTGHPQLTIYTFAALPVWTLARNHPSPWKAFGIVVLAMCFAAGITAVQLLPLYESYIESLRAGLASEEYSAQLALEPLDLLTALFPFLYGTVGDTVFFRNITPPDPNRFLRLWERSWYFGVTPLLLALLGARSLAARHSAVTHPSLRTLYLPLLAILLLSFCILLGPATPAFKVLRAVPVLGNLRNETRALALVFFAAAVAAGAGMDAAMNGERWKALRRPAFVAFWILVLVSCASLILSRSAVQSITSVSISAGGGLISLALPLLLSALSSFALLWNVSAPRVAGLLLLTVIDAVVFARAFHPSAPTDVVRRISPASDILRSEARPYRKLTVTERFPYSPEAANALMFGSASMRERVEDLNGFSSLQPAALTRIAFGRGVRDLTYGLVPATSPILTNRALINLLNVRYLLFDPREPLEKPPGLRLVYTHQLVEVYENTMVHDRFYVADPAGCVPLQRNALRADVGWTQTQFADCLAEDWFPAPKADQSALEIQSYRSEEIKLAAASTEPLLIVSSHPHLSGWNTYVDGQMMPVLKIQGAFWALGLPPGTHTIELKYWPRLLTSGLYVSALSALLLSLLLTFISFHQARCPPNAP